MRLPVLFLLLVINLPSIAQTTIYKAFEADTAAEPRGGMEFLTTFIQANLRKPIAAEAKGIGGRAILSGVVEADGRITQVKLLNAFRPDCGREALRVFNLFNAWKPAYKDGKPVRQEVTMPVFFKPNTPFVYMNGARVNYFDADRKSLPDSSERVRYKQVAPLDTNGFASGDLIVYKGRAGNWKEEYRIPLVRQVNDGDNPLDQSTTTIGYQNSSKLWDGEVLMLHESGTIISQSFYKNGQPIGTGMRYSQNGLVAEKTEEFEESFTVTSWYDNGQIREIRLNKKAKPTEKPIPTSIVAYWAPTGQQLVKEGNGRAVYNEIRRSHIISALKIRVIEQGMYENGLKQGLWSGRYTDDSYFYEETYEKGICTGGKAKTMGSDTVRYTELEQQAEYKGGMQALGQFLSNTLRYPADAQRARVQGRVVVSFIINTDGSVVDIQALNKLGFGTEQEAVRVVKNTSGSWKPGTQRGEKVRVKYNMPINFTLN